MILSIATAALLFCSVDSVHSAQYLLRNADAVVVAQLIREAAPEMATSREAFPNGSHRVEFAVQEILKGTDVPGRFVVPGTISVQDDFNDHAVPYSIVRPEGRWGSCFATKYRLNATYLLFLRRSEGSLTPYWSAFAPTNEQIRGPDDPWLRWVREYLEAP
jgi:hypothetical protein